MTELSRPRVILALLALAIGGFAIGTTEFVAFGLLPDLAHDLLPELYARNRPAAEGQAGQLISAYALGVVVGAPTIAAIGAKFPRKRLLLFVLGWFVVGSIASAVLPSFGFVLAARFVAGLPHGAYFGVAALVAASIMGPGKRARGIALVLSGLTIANVLGVPAVTALGQATNWRSAYLVVAALFALTFVAVLVTIPHQKGDPAATIGRELGAFRRPQVWIALLTGSIGFGGFFAVYSYVAPVLTSVTHLDKSFVPIALIVTGLGMTIGNPIGGRFADHHVMASLFTFFGALMVSMVLFGLCALSPIGLLISLFLIGFSSAGLSPSIQTRVLDVAGDSQTIAAAVNHSALNLGNFLGAAIGGAAIAAGLGYLAPTWLGLALCVPGILLAVTGVLVQRRSARAEALRAENVAA
jgi:MFS transporter, DHA1 family, inner membrane transport protein